MDALTFFGLERVADHHWRFEVVPTLCAGGQFLFGGCGLGAAIEVMEQETSRPVVWATSQYLSYATPPSVLDLDVTIAVDGRNTTQARAVGRVDDTEIFTVNAALGERDTDIDGQWAARPDVPDWEECPARELRNPGVESIGDVLEMRLADGRGLDRYDGTPSGDGRSALWIRMPTVLEMSPAALAVLGDFVPFGIGQASGRQAGGNSLDNTLRVVRMAPTDWVLCDIRVHGIARGFGHGLVHLWAEDGTLLATASQSVIVRFWQG